MVVSVLNTMPKSIVSSMMTGNILASDHQLVEEVLHQRWIKCPSAMTLKGNLHLKKRKMIHKGLGEEECCWVLDCEERESVHRDRFKGTLGWLLTQGVECNVNKLLAGTLKPETLGQRR